MKNYHSLFENSDGSFILKLALETSGFDFEQNLRLVKISIFAENNSGETVAADSAGKLGSIEIFGKVFSLPNEFSIEKGEEKAIFVSNEFEIDNNLYNSSAAFLVSSEFSAPGISLLPVNIAGEVTFPVVASNPTFRFDANGSITLGENVTVLSAFVDDGYTLNLGIYDNGVLIFSKEITPDDYTFFADPEWANAHPNENSFTLKVKARARYGDFELPNEGSFNKTFTVPADLSLPVAVVSLSFLCDDSLAYDFGQPIVNRSSVKISVSDITCYQGATLASTLIRFNGVNLANGVDTVPITFSGRQSWAVIITDSRGKVREYSDTFNSKSYGTPDFETAVERVVIEGDPNEDIKFKITPTILYTLSGANSYTYAYRYRNCAEGDFSGWVSVQSDIETTVNADMEPNTVYELQVRATDLAGLSTTHTYTVNCSRADLYIGRNRLGIGKRAETMGAVECAWDIKCDGDISFTAENGDVISLREALAQLGII